jgi:hypothetical protein
MRYKTIFALVRILSKVATWEEVYRAHECLENNICNGNDIESTKPKKKKKPDRRREGHSLNQDIFPNTKYKSTRHAEIHVSG